MDLIIVAFYAFCGDLLIQSGHQDHPKAKMSAAEVMTIASVATQFFGDNQQMTRHADESGDIFSIC